MFRLESDAENVFLNLRRSIELADDNIGEYLRKGAVESVAIIADRVQQKGMGSDGSRLSTKARLRAGAYSKGHAKRRAERGRQTSYVDLTNENDLFRNFQVLTTGPKLATAGFLDNRQADKAEYLEDYYGSPIFSLSSAEQDFVVDGIMERLIDDLRR